MHTAWFLKKLEKLTKAAESLQGNKGIPLNEVFLVPWETIFGLKLWYFTEKFWSKIFLNM